MSIADAIRELETKLEKTEAALKEACLLVASIDAEKDKLKKKCDRLQEDLNATAAQRDEIKKLKAQLKVERESVRVKKLKATIEKLEKKLGEEQSMRMKAENKPEVEKERDRLKDELAALMKDMPAYKEAARTVRDIKRENKLIVKALDVYEAAMIKAGLKLPEIEGVPKFEHHIGPGK